MKYITTLASVLLLTSATTAYAQAWREIKPIESTCKDVEGLLKVKACGKQQVEYRLPSGGMMYISFERAACRDKFSPATYNVSPGTVIGVWASLALANVSISDLHLDESKLRKRHAEDYPGFIYESKEVGIFFEATEEGQVTSVNYSPAARYDNLLCFPPTKAPPNNYR